MTAVDDMRTLRDALEQVAQGGLPTWYPSTTLVGEQAFIAAQSVIGKWHKLMMASCALEEQKAQIDHWLDDARTHADLLTRQLQAAESEVERLRAALPKGAR